MLKYEEYIKKNNLGVVYLDKSFKDITTLKIGGKIKLLFYPYTIDNFILFYKFYLLNKDLPIVIVGNGSNILASSNDYNGIVVCFKKVIFKYFIYKNQVIVNCGVMNMDLINFLKQNNIGGLEKLSYIPATIGGMVKMNASAYNKNISDNINYLKCLDENGNIIILYKKDLIFKYRDCNLHDKMMILECCFDLEYKNQNEINIIMEKIKKNRYLKQPLNYYNAGSTFKNIYDKQVWKLIDDVGLRGFNINGAQVSEKHCNFLINTNHCHSADMIRLINLIKDKVYKKFNLDLQCEWIFINF